MKKYITFLLIFISCSMWAQSYQVDDIKIGLERGKCFQASILIDKSTIIDSGNRKNYYGSVTRNDPQASFEIVAYPQGEQPGSHNRINVVAYSRNGGYQEMSLTFQGNTTIFYPDKIKSYSNSYGYHFELGNTGANVVEQLLLKELVKIDITESNCNGNNLNPSTQITNVYIQNTTLQNSNVGCDELHDAINVISKKMYKWPNEDKGISWASAQTKKIYELPDGCYGRSNEINKLFYVATKLYPKFNEDDERHNWFKTMLEKSFKRPSNYIQDKLSNKIDEILDESNEIFDWHEEDKRVNWVTKKINQILE